MSNLNPNIGHFHDDNLVINWKALVDEEDIYTINNMYNGKLRACTWQRRYCTYYGGSQELPWLHSTILKQSDGNYVIHHISAVSSDNREKNLHILPKIEHDGINHPDIDERKKMFSDPEAYWIRKKEESINEFIKELSLIFTEEGKHQYIESFAKENLSLIREILIKARYDINLSMIKENKSRNRSLNSHLQSEYLDAYETINYLKKQKTKKQQVEGQMKIF